MIPWGDEGLSLGGILAALAAGSVTIALVPACKRIARSLKALDPPGPRKTQEIPIPRLGGLAIATGVFVGASIGLAVYPSDGDASLLSPSLLLFGLATALIFLTGLADDLFDISFKAKFVAQFIAATIVVASGWAFSHIRVLGMGDVPLDWAGPLLSILWIVGVTNAINLIDGLDGLAGGIVAIISVSFLVQAIIQQNNPLLMLMMAAVTGACLGFLFFNWRPASIFMGDSGSLTLGFVLASMSAQASLKTNAAVAILVPILALGLPVMDTFLVMLVRVFQNPNSSLPDRLAGMFKADRRHLHHILLVLYPNRRTAVMGLYALTVLFCVGAVLVAWKEEAMWGSVLLLVGFAAIVGIRTLGLQAETRALALERRRETRHELLDAIHAEKLAAVEPMRHQPPSPNEVVPHAYAANGSNGHGGNGHGGNGHGGQTVTVEIEDDPAMTAKELTSSSPGKCIFTIDVEDWFHILDVESSPKLANWGALPSTVERNFRHLLDIVEEGDLQATCFFLGWIAERFPELAREAGARGHEIASHGYSHELAYQMGPQRFGDDARKSRLLLEEITGREVKGYRAAGFSVTEETPWFLEKLAEAGYSYSSSAFPAARGHGGLPSAPLSPYTVRCKSGSMVELPISVQRVLGKPICFFGGGFLRLFPWPVIRRMTESVLAEGRPVIFYIHPREIDPQHPRLGMSPLRRFKTYVNMHSTEEKLRRIVDTFQFCSFAEYVDTLEGVPAA